MPTKPEETKCPSMEEEEERGRIRIYVGGLGESVTREDVLKIFSPMGSVEAVDFVRTKGRSLAYVDFSPPSHNSLTKLFSTYNGCVWKGGKLRLEKAKEHYLSKLRREWEESSEDNTVCLPQPPTPTSESSHLNIFFPRLRKVKSVPFTGTGKHKYSFQRVEVPSLPRYFCDCEEHSASHTLQGNGCHDVESGYAGINKEELNIMNTVMNRLFQANNEQETESFPANIEDNNFEDDDDQDNLVINVVSSENTMLSLSRNLDQETVSRKRKSKNNGIQETSEGYTQGEKRNCVRPSKLKQLLNKEESGTKKSTLAIPENNELSEVNKSSSRIGSDVNNLRSSVPRSQKSSWKALLASANDNKFSVSSVLSDLSSSKEQQHTSSKSDFVNLPAQEDLNLKEVDVPSMERSTVKKPKSKSKTLRKTGKLAADTTARKESTPADTNVEAQPVEVESSVRDAAIDTSSQNLTNEETIVDTDSNPIASTLVTSAKDDQFLTENLDAEKELCKDTENLAARDNANTYSDAGKEPLEAYDRVARGSSWRQKSSWTQLVREKNSSFSITHLFPDLNPKNDEPREVSHEDDERSISNHMEGAAIQSESKPNEDGFRAVDLINKDSVTRNSSDGYQPNNCSDALTAVTTNEARDASEKSPIGARTGVVESCMFMRSDASLKAWKDAKRAVTDTRKIKRHGN